MRQVEERVRQVKRQLHRRVRIAEAPLHVWERPDGLTGLKGDVLIVEGRDVRTQEIVAAAEGQGFGADIATSAPEAMSLIRIAKYDMVIVSGRRRGGLRLIHEIRRNFPGIRLVPVVRHADEGREMMRNGAYSYLLPDYQADQISTCILSGLHLRHHVCQTLLRGDSCDKSCVSSFMREGELDDLFKPTPQEPSLSPEQEVQPREVEYYQKVEDD